jgi:hypothetical protein
VRHPSHSHTTLGQCHARHVTAGARAGTKMTGQKWAKVEL